MITPAVIDGQKSYHQRLTAKIRTWVKAHPEEFGTRNDDIESEEAVGGTKVDVQTENGEVTPASADGSKDLLHHAKQIWGAPITMGIIALGVLLVAINVYQLLQSGSRRLSGEKTA